MKTINRFKEEVNQLRGDIDNLAESISERLSQYRSECAMFGDAGPGQHPSLWLSEAEKEERSLSQQLVLMLSSPEGQELLKEELHAHQAFIAELYKDEPASLQPF